MRMNRTVRGAHKPERVDTPFFFLTLPTIIKVVTSVCVCVCVCFHALNLLCLLHFLSSNAREKKYYAHSQNKQKS